MTMPNAQAVVIGASAGAVDAFMHLLPSLPKDYPLPIMIVMHMPPDKKSVMADLLQSKCQINVREAEDKEPLQPGTAYFSPPDYHLLVESDQILSLSTEDPVMFSRPSIDVLFETAADAYGENLIGIILTGANSDGASGLRAVVDAGGVALVQRPDLAYAATMPEAALAVCPEAQSLSMDDIASFLQKAGMRS